MTILRWLADPLGARSAMGVSSLGRIETKPGSLGTSEEPQLPREINARVIRNTDEISLSKGSHPTVTAT